MTDCMLQKTPLSGAALWPGAHELASAIFSELREAAWDGGGITRCAYTEAETQALHIIETYAVNFGLDTRRDSAGNLVVILAGRNAQKAPRLCGSHIDSVTRGGNYDGAAGIVAGLLTLISMKIQEIVPVTSIHLYAFRGEESASFGRPYLGSSAVLGLLSHEDIELTQGSSGRLLGDCLRDVGAHVESIARKEPILKPEDVSVWLELHIEQGNLLEEMELPVAIVTGIRGNFRYRSITCHGHSGHAGIVPRAVRRDAVMAVSDFLMRMDAHWARFLQDGHDLVMTAGCFTTDPAEHSVTRIPGAVEFSFEARSQSPETLEAFHRLFLHECQTIQDTRGVSFDFHSSTFVPGAVLSGKWQKTLSNIMNEMGLSPVGIASGAGHDTVVFSQLGIPSAMIFIRNQNGSHNPNESMELEDFLIGTEVLLRSLLHNNEE